MPRVARVRPKMSANESPVMFGMFTSSSTRSGRSCNTATTAPVARSRVTTRKPACSSVERVTSSTTALSSITKMVRALPYLMRYDPLLHACTTVQAAEVRANLMAASKICSNPRVLDLPSV